jgi:tricorn protease
MNLYRLRVGEDESKAQRLTNYNDIEVEDFDISADGKTLVFARWNRLHRVDLTQPNARPSELSVLASEDAADRYQLKDMSRTVSDAAISPDGKTMAYIAYGDVYVRGYRIESPARRVTTKPSRERDIAWSADGEHLYFVSDESGMEAIYSASVKLTRSDVKKQYESATKGDASTKPQPIPPLRPRQMKPRRLPPPNPRNPGKAIRKISAVVVPILPNPAPLQPPPRRAPAAALPVRLILRAVALVRSTLLHHRPRCPL